MTLENNSERALFASNAQGVIPVDNEKFGRERIGTGAIQKEDVWQNLRLPKQSAVIAE